VESADIWNMRTTYWMLSDMRAGNFQHSRKVRSSAAAGSLWRRNQPGDMPSIDMTHPAGQVLCGGAVRAAAGRVRVFRHAVHLPGE